MVRGADFGNHWLTSKLVRLRHLRSAASHPTRTKIDSPNQRTMPSVKSSHSWREDDGAVDIDVVVVAAVVDSREEVVEDRQCRRPHLHPERSSEQHRRERCGTRARSPPPLTTSGLTATSGVTAGPRRPEIWEISGSSLLLESFHRSPKK